MANSDFIEAEMTRRKSENQLRVLRNVKPLSPTIVEVHGQPMINFSSNDYLGLSKHPLLQQRAIEYTQQYGTGSTASRLICGSYDCFETIERKLASLKNSEDILIFNSGFQANVSIIPVLVDADALIFSDSLNHSSIIQGISLAACQKQIYEHNNLDHLQELLKEHSNRNYSRILIVTESVFSMDGDQSDIDGLITLAKSHNAMLMIDEAHATGVLGERGMGLTAGKDVDIVMGTFGKALGSFGAYIACSSQLRAYLINCCPGIIYSTALPPPVLGAIDAALELVPQMETERADLQRNAEYFRNQVSQFGFEAV